MRQIPYSIVLIFLCIASGPAGGEVLRWTAAGNIWISAPIPESFDLFAAGDYGELSIFVDTESEPRTLSEFGATYQPLGYSLKIGTYVFDPDVGTSLLGVHSAGHFGFEVRFPDEIPLPGHWIEKIAFQIYDNGLTPGAFVVPTNLLPAAHGPFDFDFVYPAGNSQPVFFVNQQFSVQVVSAVPVSGIGLIFCSLLPTLLIRHGRA